MPHQTTHHFPTLQRGLTLVELMAMLLVIGVLAVVALPKYADVQMRARVAKLKATAQSLQVVSALMRTTATSRGADCRDAAPASLTIDGETIALVHCHPQALGAFEQGVLAAAKLSAADGWLLSLAAGQSGSALPGATVAIEVADAPLPASCALAYTAASRDTPPQINTRSSGC